jgi:hypothetical protein
MELTLEWTEIERLLRKAIEESYGMRIPEDAVMRKRLNHKKGTMRIVFVTPGSDRKRKKHG